MKVLSVYTKRPNEHGQKSLTPSRSASHTHFGPNHTIHQRPEQAKYFRDVFAVQIQDRVPSQKKPHGHVPQYYDEPQGQSTK